MTWVGITGKFTIYPFAVMVNVQQAKKLFPLLMLQQMVNSVSSFLVPVNAEKIVSSVPSLRKAYMHNDVY